MTPDERQLVDALFARLATLESVPRDQEAERAVADGIRRAPHALYALVQTALLQDEALKRANARIEELTATAEAAAPPPAQQAGFLDSMRAAFAPRETHETRGSVPTVRAQSAQQQDHQPQNYPPQGYPPQGFPPQPNYPAQPGSGYGTGSPFGMGGSFLGTAASTAAGMMGGALLLDGIRSMFGHHFGGYGPNAFGTLGDSQAAPWERVPADSQLARDAGIDHINDRHDDTDVGWQNDRDSLSGNDPFQNGSDDPQQGDDGNFQDDSDYGNDGSGDDSYNV